MNRRYNEAWYVGNEGGEKEEGTIMVSFQFFMPFSTRDGKERKVINVVG